VFFPFAARRALLVFGLAAVLYLLFFQGLSGVGLLGPDEPRYASIGREMATSGDWVTPRLWGQPWFEKPALIYWMAALGFRLGLGPEMAPRLPVALTGTAFLVFFFFSLRREFGPRVAAFSTAILGTSAGWIAFSHAAVADLPMSAAFAAAMLLCLPWIDRGERGRLWLAGALMGVAVLAKGLVPLVLALPLVWMARRRLGDALRPGPVLAFVLVAAPWYVLVGVRNGLPFFTDFILKHHLERFVTGGLQHVQPFWFYAPILLAGLFPWTPLLAPLFRPSLYPDARRRFLLLWLVFGLVFFSAATNKLPGYLLPLLPACAALMGVALDECKRAGWMLALSGALLGILPAAVPVLPQALREGLSHTNWTLPGWEWALAPALALAMGALAGSGRRQASVALLAAFVTGAIVYTERTAFPALDESVSARGFWTRNRDRAREMCVGNVDRSWRYNLNYYSVEPLATCAESPRPLRIEAGPDGIPAAVSAGPPGGAGASGSNGVD
jgi:4-amino-4-deoxy-L-arabinose transferase-like glycosyltransferase